MSKGEVKALRGLAQIHGGDLTINPKTGLPEAGFLSSILPTIVGIGLNAAFPGSGLLIAGGVGLATAALTGDLGQGLMAGLGAWSGSQLAGDVTKLGTQAATQAGQDVATKTFEDSLIQAGGSSSNQFVPSLLQSSAPTTATDIATSQMNSFNAAFNPAQQQAYANAIKLSGGDPATLSKIVGSAGSANAANLATASPFNTFSQGLTEIGKNPLQFVKDNPFHTLAAVAPVIDYALTPEQIKQKEKEDQNPFGFKKLSPDFKGTFGIRPDPYYQAKYTDYTKTPYIPGAAGGGLQTAHYANKGLVNYGLGLLNQEQKPAPITMTDPGAAYSPAYNALGLSPYEKDTEGMSSDKMAQSILKQAKALGKMASRASVMMPDPAKTAMASIQNDGQTPSAKEGGLQGYALGGLSMGHLGGYSDGGRLLKGPGDGVSDSIPASIGHKQPARLAEGEFVIPARIVSELGNGSTDAGAKRLYAMMDRIKAKRAKTKNIAADTKTYNYLPA
jgi:hypothetical protein